MLATPSPVISPPRHSAPACAPAYATTKSPTPTTTTATSALKSVSPTSYLIVVPGKLNPSMAIKCMTQTPVPPIDSAASINQALRDDPEEPCARAVHSRPSADPMHDITYASAGVSTP